MSRNPHALLISFCLSGIASTSLAQDGGYDSIVRFGGQAQVLAETCVGMTPAEGAARKKEQADAMAKLGMTPARFEQLFAEGYAASQGKLKAATAQQRSETCAKLKSIGQQR